MFIILIKDGVQCNTRKHYGYEFVVKRDGNK